MPMGRGRGLDRTRACWVQSAHLTPKLRQGERKAAILFDSVLAVKSLQAGGETRYTSKKGNNSRMRYVTSSKGGGS